jgi:cytochrome P450
MDRGQKIRAGEAECLFYPSANRDENVFEKTFKFDIGRNPNPHLGFGIGEHFCLGSNLARLELEIIFRELGKRLEHAELAEPWSDYDRASSAASSTCQFATSSIPATASPHPATAGS